MSVYRFSKLLRKYSFGYVQRSPPAEGPSSRCEPNLPAVRRSELVDATRPAKQHVDTSRFFVSASSVDDVTPAGSSELRSTMRRSASSGTTSFQCRSFVDDDVVAVDWTSVRLVFVVLDVLLLVHRMTKLYVELDRMRLSAPVLRFWPLSDGCAEGISVLPVDGVAPDQTNSGPEHAQPYVGNHVGNEARGSGDDDEVFDSEPRTNSLCVTTERCGSNSVSSTLTRRQAATGSRSPWRRRTRSSPDIVPRLICLVALLAALFYARTSTTSRGVLWLRSAVPSLGNRSSSIFTSAVRRHFYDDVGVDSLSSDFRQLQAFVDFFNRGKLVLILRDAVSK